MTHRDELEKKVKKKKVFFRNKDYVSGYDKGFSDALKEVEEFIIPNFRFPNLETGRDKIEFVKWLTQLREKISDLNNHKNQKEVNSNG